MKAVTIILLATVALAGCTTMGRNQSRESDKHGASHYGSDTVQKANESPPYHTHEGQSKQSISRDRPITALPKKDVEAILRALKGENKDAENISVENLGFIATFDRKGHMILITTRSWDKKDKKYLSKENSPQRQNITRESKAKFPIKNEAILQIQPFSIVPLKGSHKMVIQGPDQNGMSMAASEIELPPPHPCFPEQPYPDWTC